eukprot:c19463_g1_i6.p1 GENE.c19463_g1_i6~~c19463_g1_i6.p1  ORF type:complete len:349 (+),score=103.17 c19463_g1_i6:130-1176(+)
MGCVPSNSNDKGKNKSIDAELNRLHREQHGKVKLLLLGTGESGKSTIFKQMKILYGEPDTDEDRAMYTTVIYSNTLSGMKELVHMVEEWGLISECQCPQHIELLKSLPESSRIDITIGTAIKELWADDAIQKVWKRRTEFQVIESFRYFFDNIDKIMDPEYLATHNDFLFTRVRTSGVVTNTYLISGVKFEMYDVGGQRNERRKWIHCFSDVTSVIFVAALSEYDQVLFEDSNINRMKEALELFDEICRLDYFKHSAFILFLNKYDLFLEKLSTNPINNVPHWIDYTGGADPVNARNYFRDQFFKRNKDSKRTIYFHITTATDTSNIQFVFEACKEIILERNIDDSGF